MSDENYDPTPDVSVGNDRPGYRQNKDKMRKMTDDELLALYEQGMEAQNVGAAQGGRQAIWGRRVGGRAQRALGLLTDRGVDVSGVDINDYSSGEYDDTELSAAWNLLTREGIKRYNQTGKERMGFGALRKAKLQEFMQAQNIKKSETYFNENIDPQYAKAQEMASKLAETNAVSAEQEAAIRSRTSAAVQQAAATNLKRVGALFGQKGLQDSPAAAAYASRVAEDYDSQMVNTLRDLGLDVAQINRDAITRDAGTISQLATARLAGRNAAVAGDQATMLAIQGNLGELVQAIGDRRKVLDLLEKQYKDATDESTVDRINSWTGAAKGIVSLAGGAMGAYSGLSSLGGGGSGMANQYAGTYNAPTATQSPATNYASQFFTGY